MKKIYFDYAATTPVDPAVLRAMKSYCTEKFGNPGSLHFFGQEAIAAVDRARETIARSLGRSTLDGFREIIFTGSATEANNLALRGVFRAIVENVNIKTQNNSVKRKSSVEQNAKIFNFDFSTLNFRPRIITSVIEHESVLETCRDLQKDGIEVIYIKPKKNGIINPADVARALNEQTILVSIMHANNEIGTIQPIAEISEIIKNFREESGAENQELAGLKLRISSRSLTTGYPLLHTDAVQAFQFLDCHTDVLGVDLMTLSAHKIYGPKGIGALYIRNSDLPRLISSIVAGGGQEFGLRSGTENVSAIVGFARATELAISNKKKAIGIGKLRDDLWKGIKKIYPRAQLNGDMKNRLPNIANVYFPGHRAEDLLMKFDLAGVAASSGSACRARSAEPSHTLSACGFSRERVESSVRFSIGRPTTKREINEALRRMRKIMALSSSPA